MSDLKPGEKPKPKKLYFKKEGSELIYILISPKGEEIVDKMTLLDGIPDDLTKEFLYRKS